MISTCVQSLVEDVCFESYVGSSAQHGAYVHDQFVELVALYVKIGIAFCN